MLFHSAYFIVAMMKEVGVNNPVGFELLEKGAWHISLETQLTEAIHSGSPLSVLFVDINNFSEVNNELGHVIGDEVLAEIKGVVSQVTTQFLVGGHIGGDEFAISGTADAEAALAIKSQLRQAFNDYLDGPGNEELRQTDVGLAIGTSTYAPGMSKYELLRQADEAMYDDKLSQLPELTDEQHETLIEARIALLGVGLRLRDLYKYDKLLKRQNKLEN